MSSWYPSWLPGLPAIDFTLPSAIQRRFLSFILKKSLGHLLKPGQLDIHQIDSQIGSGYVQVRDLELSNEAVNAHLAGLPVKLHDSSISVVTARIPWPNPITSTVGFSIQSLHLTFHLSRNAVDPHSPSPVNLADSVASVAGTFIHDELSPREEATLRESFHTDISSSTYDDRNLPGGFLSVPEDDEFQADIDPSGVSIFATLIERLLSRFTFDAVDTKITLVHPEHASFTLSVQEVRYGTKGGGGGEGESGVSNSHGTGVGIDIEEKQSDVQGKNRTVSISGVALTAQNLQPPAIHSPPALTPSTLSPVSPTVSHLHPPLTSPALSPSASPASSSSSLDEETQLMMSQSLACLPPRLPLAPSPPNSTASSLYESAISVAPTTISVAEPSASVRLGQSSSRTQSPEGHEQIVGDGRSHSSPSDHDTETEREAQIEEDIIFSFGSEPITICLTGPRPVTLPPSSSSSSTPFSRSSVHPAEGNYHRPKEEVEKLNFSVSIGVFACAFRAWHIRRLLDVADVWSSHQPFAVPTPTASSNPPSSTTSSVFGLGFEASIAIRSIVIILLSSSANPLTSAGSATSAFFERPLVPPCLPHGYVRVHIENIAATLSSSSPEPGPTVMPLDPIAGQRIARETSAATISGPVTTIVTLSLSEFSVFAFHSSLSNRNDNEREAAAPRGHNSDVLTSPILITDQYLPTQYSSTHVHPDGSTQFTSKSASTSERPLYTQLPTFEVTNWTGKAHGTSSAKISTWRTKQKTRPARPSENAPRPPAIVVNAKRVQPLRQQVKDKNSVDTNISVAVVPLHLFLDLGLMLDVGALAYLDEAAGPDSSVDPNRSSWVTHSVLKEGYFDQEGGVGGDPGSTPPATPRAQSAGGQEHDRDRERRRLERLVLQDLDLDLDYRGDIPGWKAAVSPPVPQVREKVKVKRLRSRKRDTTSFVISLVMIRVQARCPSPPQMSPRSGSLVLDLHDLKVVIPPESQGLPPTARFTGIDGHALTPSPAAGEHFNSMAVLSAECRRLVVATSVVDEGRACAVLSLGPLLSEAQAKEGIPENPIFGANTSPPDPSPLLPRLRLTRSNTADSLKPNTLALSFDIPSVHANLSKLVLDATQLWADDATQLVERTFGRGDTETENRNPSLIGSRFFAKSRTVSSRGSESEIGSRASGSAGSNSEIVIKFAIAEAFVQLMLPRGVERSMAIRPFDVSASDIDILMEFKPEGKDETVFTVGVLDLNINDTSPSNSQVSLMCLTSRSSSAPTPTSVLKLRFTSLIIAETTAKESRIKLTLCGFTYYLFPDLEFVGELGRFFKAPPGAFESVVPSERTRVVVKVVDGSIRASAPVHPGSAVMHVGDLEFSTDVVGNSSDMSFHLLVPSASVLLNDDLSSVSDQPVHERTQASNSAAGVAYWKQAGFALLAEVADLDLAFDNSVTNNIPHTQVVIDRIALRAHLCADTAGVLAAFSQDLISAFNPPANEQMQRPKAKPGPSTISVLPPSHRGLMSTVDEDAFRRAPEVGPAPDMIIDDLPTNMDYLDESFSAAAGLRELRDDDLDDFDLEEAADGSTTFSSGVQQRGVISNVGGETIKMLRPIQFIDGFFDTLPPDTVAGIQEFGDTTTRIRIHDCDLTLFLYDGYDWTRTRKTIEDGIKEMRRRLAKIRQLVASGQTQDPTVEETSALLFNSVYIGLDGDVNELDPGALVAAIDEELDEDTELASQSSWQSLPPPSGKIRTRSSHMLSKRLTRSRGPSIEFRLSGVDAEVDHYPPNNDMVSRTFATVRDIEILDHIKTSTWKKFLTELRSDSQGNIRETDSNMVQVELRSVHPVPNHTSEETRLRAKILPLRLYVDQDALDFLKQFFNFKDINAPIDSGPETSEGDIYFQHAEVFPIDLKLDYKPRRVDYRALREGRTIELMNFFHFDGAEMTLRHITLSGITGWPRLFDLLNDLWTPDVKATQLVDVISGVSPIRSVVNVGSGVADLVLLPIAQYKKDGRIVRGVQKGTTAFVKSTAMEAIKLGARLATGTQVILERAENVLGGRFDDSVTAEALQIPSGNFIEQGQDAVDEEMADLISKYAEQPGDVREGVQSAYRSLQKNLHSAAQTILAVPMEVYERSGNEGPVRAVVRAVPIAVLKPMIGASEAVSKTLMGLHNTLDPNVRHENEAKYKQR